MPAGDLTIVQNAESWAGVSGVQTTPGTNSFVSRLITAASRRIARHLNRDLLTLGGQGYSSVAGFGTDSGGAFLLLASGLGVTAEKPGGLLPAVGAAVSDFLNSAATTVVASTDLTLVNVTTVNKVYVASTTGFVVGDPINVVVYPTFNETHTGVGSDAMQLNEWPLVPAGTLGSLALGGVPLLPINATPSNPTLYQDAGYILQGNNDVPPSIKYYRFFPRCLGNILAVYQAGYSSVPSDIEQVCIELVGLKVKEKDRIGVTAKSFQGEHISFFTGGMTKSHHDYLRNYRRTTPRWP